MPLTNKTIEFDAIVIGAGQSGPPLAARLAEDGMKVAIVERNRFGGTCVNNGCVPTKSLVASAHAAHIARRCKDFGVVVGGPIKLDMKAVKARKDAIVARSRDGVEQWMKGADNITVYEGHATFEQERTLRVGDDLLAAERIYINVGGRAAPPPIPGLDGVPYLNNASMMDVDYLPEHLMIIGGSYIGLEFAQMYRRFGSAVTIIERGPRLVAREDEDISEAIRGILEDEDISVITDAGDFTVAGASGGITVDMLCKGVKRRISGSHLLVATGRTPNTQDLGLDRVDIEVDGRGFIKTDEELRTNAPGVWAMGDCNGRGAFTHTSYNDFEIISDNLLKNDSRRTSDRFITYGLFIDPPLARVGLTEREVHESGRKALIGKRSMTRVGRAVERGETQGLMKILVDAENEKILGAALLGIGCDEAIHCLIDVMYADAPYTVIQRAMHIHPTVAELIPTILNELEPLA